MEQSNSIETKINSNRFRFLNKIPESPGEIETKFGVVYWMSRDQRTKDNWALILSQEYSILHKLPIAVIFNIVPSFLGATQRSYNFMIEGLKQVEQKLHKLNIPMFVLIGEPEKTITSFILDSKTSYLITDFSPLRINKDWKSKILSEIETKKINVNFIEVDTHNIIPVWITSQKQEFAARTIRPKIESQLNLYLLEFPILEQNKIINKQTQIQLDSKINWTPAMEIMSKQIFVPEISWILPGESQAEESLKKFCKNIEGYSKKRNDPSLDCTSNLSPYFHFGQLSPQRAALEVRNLKQKFKDDVEAFLEELIIRRELSDNYCHYNLLYDQWDGFPSWAKQSLTLHASDVREYTYSLEEFESYNTHDELWNAAQIELVHRGKMSSYMRMYWAKKILEWTKTPQEAWNYALELNDKYELDGRDPNGYVGVAWSVGGVHDRGWTERLIFGKVRFMNFQGMKRKFDIKKYTQNCQKLIMKSK